MRGGARNAALMDFGSFSLISQSPELFFRIEPLADGRRRIVNRPIKGTRANLPGMQEELRDSAKDQAELAMIVDLQRNDLGRICEIGSVKVTQPRVIEIHPTVLHGVATIEGILRQDVELVDILRAMFPCGSITGCPKIRAMEVIEELEPVRRGPYCGAIGWIAADGAMEFSVAIRTIVLKDGLAYVPVGGGIVADSDPAAEYEETLVKAKAALAALRA
jgi:anthranilate/para-aminobenzoate synthase component I